MFKWAGSFEGIVRNCSHVLSELWLWTVEEREEVVGKSVTFNMVEIQRSFIPSLVQSVDAPDYICAKCLTAFRSRLMMR